MSKKLITVKLGSVLAAVLALNACATGGGTSQTYAAPMVPAARGGDPLRHRRWGPTAASDLPHI